MVTARLHGSSISLMVSTCLEAILQFMAKSSKICISKASDSHPHVLKGNAPHAISKARSTPKVLVRPTNLASAQTHNAGTLISISRNTFECSWEEKTMNYRQL